MFCLIWFGSDSPQLFFAFVLAPIPGLLNLLPTSGHFSLFISVHFAQLGRSAGGG